MISRRGLGGVLLGGCAMLVLGGCAEQSAYRFRFRLLVVVDTPYGERSGSGVYEVWANWSLPGATSRIWGERGEAVAVDLPNGRTLFSLLKTGAIHGDLASMSMATLDKKFNNSMVESAKSLSSRAGGEGVVAPENYPMLVTFKDITNPASVERVDPADLEASFGKGYRLKSISVQITDDPVTVGIRKRLGWFSNVKESGGGLIPMDRVRINGTLRYQPRPGYDRTLADIGLSQFSTEAYR